MVRIDAVDCHRSGFHVRPGKGRDVEAVGCSTGETSVRTHFNEHGGNLEQRVRLRIETAGLDIHHNGQEAAKARGKSDGWYLRHAAIGPNAQAIVSPAR